MNKKTLIAILAVILIIVLAIIAGVNAGKKENKQANSTPTTGSNENPVTVSPTPEDTEEPSPEPTEEPSPEPTIKPEDTTEMTDAQKIDYAISIAKVTWQKVGIDVQVSYKYESILTNGKYMIAIKNGTAVIDYCYVDIKNNTGELERYK